LKKILLLSDTHGCLDEKILNHVEQADEVWHAGDIGKMSVLDKLAKMKPLRAVYGNIDSHSIRQEAPEYLCFNCEGLKVLMLHIGGSPGRYVPRAKALITEHQPKLFVCGHSHILKVIQDPKYGHLHMNPGAVGISGFHKIRTLLRFQLEDGKINHLEAIELGLRGALPNAVNGAD
jgi:putative phosphoesterase